MSGISAAFRGNLTDDPQTRQAGGEIVATFQVAVDDGYRDRSGTWTSNPTLFVNVEAWGGTARGVARLAKGAAVVVVGQWRANTFTVNGEPRRKQYVVASYVGHDVYEVAAADSAPTQPPTAAGDDDFWAGAS